MTQVNVLFINGWLGAAPSFALHDMRDDTIAVFGNSIHCPEPFNHNDTAGILAAVKRWKDPQIFVALSCGCTTINECAKWVDAIESIPFAMYLSPSFPCGIGTRPVPPVIKRAQEVNSWAADGFNLGQRQAIKLAPGNKTTVLLPRIKSAFTGHGFTPYRADARASLHSEIRRAIAA